MFINHCQNIYWDVEKAERRVWAARYTGGDSAGNEALVGSLRDIREQILKAGFYYLFSDNPNVQYGTVRLRKTSRRVDRVYAIMQIYDIRVGKSARRGPARTRSWRSSWTSSQAPSTLTARYSDSYSSTPLRPRGARRGGSRGTERSSVPILASFCIPGAKEVMGTGKVRPTSASGFAYGARLKIGTTR
ncbi:hypothetical protein F4824DRAFT_517797 [Ustulina deusta]|nr:hypothetical protein F4824DRAFT_517797 [Ustulina deusta]